MYKFIYFYMYIYTFIYTFIIFMYFSCIHLCAVLVDHPRFIYIYNIYADIYIYIYTAGWAWQSKGQRLVNTRIDFWFSSGRNTENHCPDSSTR